MLSYRSAAKINLYLRVEGLLPGGYHELTSIMQSVSLWDTLKVDFNVGDFSLTVPGYDLGPTADNIVAKIWRLLKERFSLPGEARIIIEKHIPVGAGLAGGSGNGAAMLHAVNDYFHLGLATADLARLGGEVGSDIPFCVAGGTALAQGRGEKLSSLPPLPSCPILLANSGFHVATAAVFREFDALPLLTNGSEQDILAGLDQGNNVRVAQSLYNDLERVTLPHYPQLTSLKDFWRGQGLYPLMSGSGPAVFALAPHSSPAELAELVRETKTETFLVYPVNQGVEKLS